MKSTFVTVLTNEQLSELIQEAVQDALAGLEISRPAQQPEILDFKQACAHVRVTQSYMYKLTSNGLIPHAKRGKRLFFERSELDKWLLERKIKTADEIRQEAADRLEHFFPKSRKPRR